MKRRIFSVTAEQGRGLKDIAQRRGVGVSMKDEAGFHELKNHLQNAFAASEDRFIESSAEDVIARGMVRCLRNKM